MFKAHITAILLLATAFWPAHAQTPPSSPSAQPTAAPAPAFEVADIHPSPHSNNPQTYFGPVAHGRYTMRQYTMTNLIANAYSTDGRYVLGGPPWLDLDRFDVVGKTPNTTSNANARLMMRALLADRFHLVVHTGDKPLPAFILTAPRPKLKPAADTSVPANCEYKPQPNAQQTQNPDEYFSCHNVTMKYFAEFLRDAGGNYVRSQAVDHTGLANAYDFDIHWSYRPPQGDDGGTSLFDALDKLGLKLEAGTAPLPVINVDSVDETPTPNPPGLEKALPPLPAMSFDVATVRPSAPGGKGTSLQLRGTEIIVTNATLELLVTWMWDTESRRLVNPPDFLGKDRWDIVGKFSSDDPEVAPGQGPRVSFEDVQGMMKTLLADRFGLKAHTEDRPVDAWTLVAAGPHMTKAEGGNRTGCKPGSGPDGKDPRIANPMLGRLLYCQNITMKQFAEQLQTMASGFIKDPVIDQTGIDGSYDFLLSFSTAAQLRGVPQPSAPGGDAAPQGSSAASAPTGGISLFDALPKEMGVKLVKSKHDEPMLVIDHINEKPTDN